MWCDPIRYTIIRILGHSLSAHSIVFLFMPMFMLMSVSVCICALCHRTWFAVTTLHVPLNTCMHTHSDEKWTRRISLLLLSSSPNIITCDTTFQWYSLVSGPIHPDAVMQIGANITIANLRSRFLLPISVNIIQFSEYVIKGLFILPLFLVIFKLFIAHTYTHTRLLFSSHPATHQLSHPCSFVPFVFLFQILPPNAIHF